MSAAVIEWSGMAKRLIAVLVFGYMVMPSPVVGQTDPAAIMEQVDRLLRGDSSRGVATMEVVTENWERRMTMELWSLGTEYSLVRLRAPQREAGTATLMAEDDIWNYYRRWTGPSRFRHR